MTNLYNTNSPLNRAERKNVNDTWQDILSRFAQLQRHINFLAGEDVEEILQRIETAITNAQEATISANEAVEIINEELIKIATAISNAESARDQANTAADNATDAAQEVNIAKQNADVATLNANNAAEAANQAKQNIEVATQEARTATTNANNATNAAERATTEAEAITEIMNTLKIELEVLQTALNGIVATENARVEVEEERVTNELARIEAEDERNEKERTRITTEINRVNAENVRVEAEGERVTNELARIEAEEERNEKETARTTAETNRVNAENTRVEAEEERTQAHHILRELLNNFQSLSYDASSTYDFPAIVSYNGSTYIALQEVTGIVPNNDGVNWRLVAQRGVDGDGSVSSINGLFPDPSGNVQLNVSSNWDSIEGKPSTFTPATHKHAISDITGLQDALNNTTVDDTKYVFTDGSKTMNSITIGSRRSDSSVGVNSFTQGLEVTASGQCSHAEGYLTTASGQFSHAEGYLTTASEQCSHAEGRETTASGQCSHAKGYLTTASGQFSHAEGRETTASEQCSHAEGRETTASGQFSHAEGRETTASGQCSHAEGYLTTASGQFSHAEGYQTTANSVCSHVTGRYNKDVNSNPTTYYATNDAFVIGNGTGNNDLSNAFRVTFEGTTFGMGAFNTTGADYAEYFEWLDGNVDDEERIGVVVTLEGDKIRKANENDLYILGIISANPSVIGDSYQDDWQGKYVTDEWGRIQYHWVDVEHAEPQLPIFNEQTGEYEEQEPKKVTRKEYHPILNKNWRNETEYAPREQRPEWDAVGLVGKLYVRDDGKCQVNSYAKVGAIEGVLTNSHEPTNMRVMERVAPNIVRVFIK